MPTFIGTDGSDILVGGSAADWIAGLAGADTITGGGGADALGGGAGIDTFVYVSASDSTNTALDNLYDFTTGEDRIDLSAVPASYVSIIRTGTGSLVFAGLGAGTLAFSAAGRDINARDFVNLLGVSIIATQGSDGADVLIGRTGFDRIVGGAGDDIIYASDGAATGNDLVTGGAGADTFTFARVAGASSGLVITDFETTDRIDLTGCTNVVVSRQADGSSVVSAQYRATPDGAVSTIAMASILAPTAGAGAINGTSLRLDPGVGISMGGAGGSDFLTGTAAADRIDGGASNDRLEGGAGDDILIGGLGYDGMFGGAGRDTFLYLTAQDSPQVPGGSAWDQMQDFETGIDVLDLTAVRTGAADRFTIVFGVSGFSQNSILIDLGGDGSIDMHIVTPFTILASDIRWGLAALGEEPFGKVDEAQTLPAIVEDADAPPEGFGGGVGGDMFELHEGLGPAAHAGHDWYF